MYVFGGWDGFKTLDELVLELLIISILTHLLQIIGIWKKLEINLLLGIDIVVR